MPELRRRYPAHRVHHGARTDPEDTDPSWRTPGAAAALTCARPAHRLGRARPGSRRPRHLSGTDRRAARNRHPQPLTAAASQVTTKPRGRRTRRGSAPTREKRHSRGGRQADRERPGAHPGERSTRLTSRSSAEDARGSAIGRAILHGEESVQWHLQGKPHVFRASRISEAGHVASVFR